MMTQHKKCHVFNIVVPDGNYTNETLTKYLNTTYFCDRTDESILKNLKISVNPYNLKTIIELVDISSDDSDETDLVVALKLLLALLLLFVVACCTSSTTVDNVLFAFSSAAFFAKFAK